MINWIAKNPLDLILVIIAVIALAVSIRSCKISNKAQRIANDALEASERQFLEENRPYLIIEPVPFKETGSYFKIEQEEDRIKITLNYRMTNIGSVIAQNIIHPSIATFYENKEPTVILPAKVTPISLGPGQKISANMWVMLEKIADVSIDEYIEGFYSGKNKITHQFPVRYFTELKPSLTYNAIVEYEIYTDHVIILKSEMTTLDEQIAKE